ncbi:hypothetical protein AVEN_147934-1 [Araneus ventricosus]|uniref:Uncharacterized protein n=1 Tax=Araneus ventricosus TaxID=182803 RepID=A0A4Y2K8M4_ARAVE|nr:hypothetical protein AVEN_147934-1 [Araneus ventricosus]
MAIQQVKDLRRATLTVTKLGDLFCVLKRLELIQWNEDGATDQLECQYFKKLRLQLFKKQQQIHMMAVVHMQLLGIRTFPIKHCGESCIMF